jgi:deoxycytidylate deaminase
MTKKAPSRPAKPSVKTRHSDRLAAHRTWLARAVAVAQLPISKGGSPHPTVQVGAVLVDAKGRKLVESSNRFAEGVDRRRPERYVDGEKSLWINCAEQLAITIAARKGISLKDASLYLTLEPCAPCAGLIVEAGIREVFIPAGALRRYASLKAKYKRSIEIALVKLAEAGVRLTAIDAA